MTRSLGLLNIASMRSLNFAAVAAATAIGTLLVAGCGPASRQASLPAATTPVPIVAGTGPATGTPQVVAAASERRMPISVESNSQMKAEGNNGPSSSILRPASCRRTGSTVTAEGTYANGGLVPDVYDRYGDIVVLYVFGARSAGYAEGIQLGVSEVSDSPAVGGGSRWRVRASFSPSVGVPARCVVAAQPTHDEQFAPAPAASASASPTVSPGEELPIAVESGSQMKAAGNDGPSSAILRPASCSLTGSTVTAEGTYANGGFVPNLYDRYGDIIVLYVLGPRSSGYAEGMQLGVSDVSESPVLGGRARWQVSLSISSSASAPVRCVVAAQPTHDFQLAP